jgi:hypothetical protein
MFYRLMTQSAHWLVGDMPIMMLLQLSYWAPVQTLHMLSMRTQFLNGPGYFPSPAIWSVVQFLVLGMVVYGIISLSTIVYLLL